ncbi:threonine dehydratase, biosynthetic [Tolumonas auensis DSM 9187]|uniref:L-threonine dehydratase n=1 Tax=Tolumonas auensis (strain DSM 9187 / NBRC 110442 / TA 4) TaxID=595494 RepID=C4LDS2_TOLAT|nr:threonine ammonia-lyase, biosynthetic [Tolumonas auensis]ACQ94683.1 threonine dehydratase, biosynthetic [Tolumonas auensis DSM 9187]NCB57865.1 threonine ammonia-lyase, biosynthetic [Gammaproteobacteria bacterium]
MSDTQPQASDYLRKILLSPVYEVAKVTPLQTLKKISDRLGNHVALKREDLQPVHSFKLRGAYNKIAGLSEEQRAKGIIAASAGNHAQGVALSGAKLKIPAIIVMPTTTPDIKIDAVRRMGGNVVLFGNSFDEAYAESRRLAAEHGYTLIPPYDDVDVIAGQGTIGRELLEQDTRLTHVFVQVGGGGLAAGVAVYIKQLLPNIKVIGVEAEGSASMKAALAAGEPVNLPRVSMFADGVAVKRAGDETFRLCREYLDDIITVTNDEICAALKDIFDDTRAVAEPSGALSLAGLKKYVETTHTRGARMAAILSGANVNFHSLRYVSERCELGEKREGVLAVTIPERKGAFLEFCHILGKRMVTEFNYRYSEDKEATIFVSVRLSNGTEELLQVIADLQKSGYGVMNITDNSLAKNHVRYMVGGRPCKPVQERLFSFEFPEQPGALLRFLETLGTLWNITLFHYRNHGADYGYVLCAFELSDDDMPAFNHHLQELGYPSRDVSDDVTYKMFLAPR